VAKLSTTSDANLIVVFPFSTQNDSFRYLYAGNYMGAPGGPGNGDDLLVPGQSFINGTFNTATTYSNYHQINGPIQVSRTITSITLSSDFYSRYFIGTLAEVLFYSGPITAIERREVEGYLAAKWGLRPTLPTGHPYKSSTP
jgi:hypothetical protein